VPDLLQHIFAVVCGQNLAHTWTPGGLALPCCQRCTGLYTGAFAAAVLQLWLKPSQTSRFLWIHGVFLLVMIPFGFHWLPQGPLIRTLTGSLFGFGLTSFLWLMPAARWKFSEPATKPVETQYFLAVALCVVLVQVLVRAESQAAAYALALLCTGGLLALAALALVNLWLLAASLLGRSPASPL
jgi:uncharacterized membrane protein